MFPVAVWYGGGKARAPMLEPLDPTSPERWGHDLDQIKSVGFNTVKCWVDWATAEPSPGRFHFENLDLLLRLAEERGLRVIVQIYLDSAPDWVGERYPDGRFVDRSGAVIRSEAAPGFCIDHAGVRAEIVKFLAALARDANRWPALFGWDVWSEPHVVNWAEFPYLTNPEFCYCRWSEERFRAWLKAKYATLGALNQAWYRRFARWDQVEPPRASTILSFADYLDWRAFIADKLAGDLKTRVDAIRGADRVHPITSHAAAPGLFTSPTDGYGEPDDWKMASNADFFGTSLYPKHSESTRPWPYPMLAAALDFARSSGHSYGKGFWIGELQAGQGVTGMRIADLVSAQDEQFWMWQVVAHGAREIAVYAWYPMSSGYESNGYGLINLDGTLTDRARAAGKTAQAVERNAADILAAKPAPAEVAILYNRLAYMVGGSEPSLSKLGNAERDSLMGLHRAFFEENIPVDFVSAEDVAKGRLAQYKVLFLPFPVMLGGDVAGGVERFVKGGGTAVAEARLAWNNELGQASTVIPGHGLTEVFAAREEQIVPVDKPQLVVDHNAHLSGLAEGDRVDAEGFQEALDPLPGAAVLARFADGQPAVVENAAGQGRAIMVGSFAALSYQRDHLESTKRFLLALAAAGGVRREVEAGSRQKEEGSGLKAAGGGQKPDGGQAPPALPASEVEVRRLVGDGYQLVFIFNHARQAVEASVSIPLPWTDLEASDLVNNSRVPVRSEGGAAVLEMSLAAGGIEVVRLKPAGAAGS